MILTLIVFSWSKVWYLLVNNENVHFVDSKKICNETKNIFTVHFCDKNIKLLISWTIIKLWDII